MQPHPAALATAPVAPAAVAPASEPAKVSHAINEEYHFVHDDWSMRDILLSLVPFIVTFAFKDSALKTALAFAIAFQGFLLIMRSSAWDSKRKRVWPDIEITGIIAFAVLRGLMRPFPYHIHKWWNVILPLVFISMALLSLIIRRAFTGHYARYPKFDKGGHGLWERDTAFRRSTDIIAIFWVVAWSISLLLSLIPILTGHWLGYHVLNIIFNYVVPFLLMTIALVAQQAIGRHYFKTATRASETTIPATGTYAANYPAGVPPTYSTAA